MPFIEDQSKSQLFSEVQKLHFVLFFPDEAPEREKTVDL
jgi:hypothetical protein